MRAKMQRPKRSRDGTDSHTCLVIFPEASASRTCSYAESKSEQLDSLTILAQRLRSECPCSFGLQARFSHSRVSCSSCLLAFSLQMARTHPPKRIFRQSS